MQMPHSKEDVSIEQAREIVKRFYDSAGWTTTGEGPYEDAKRWEDLRPCSHEYIKQCHLRVNRYLARPGRFLLDAASGPVQYVEYLTYSAKFDKRICLDFSYVALREARKRLGESAYYVVGDVTQLPFADHSIDAIVSLHTVYHIHKDNQQKAIIEFARVTAPGGVDVVVYSWGKHDLLSPTLLFPLRIMLKLRRFAAWPLRVVRRRRKQAHRVDQRLAPEPYFFAHDHRWFRKLGFNLDIYPWRSMGVDVTKTWIHGRFGTLVLRLVFWMEDRFPRLLGRIGAYGTIVIRIPDEL